MSKIRSGVYSIFGHTIRNMGYYPPDRCVAWEAVCDATGESAARGKTLFEVIVAVVHNRFRDQLDEAEHDRDDLKKRLAVVCGIAKRMRDDFGTQLYCADGSVADCAERILSVAGEEHAL